VHTLATLHEYGIALHTYILQVLELHRHGDNNAAAANGRSRPESRELSVLSIDGCTPSNRASQSDFLDDKLQTLPDLESLDALLVSVRNQHVLLRKQVICHHPQLPHCDTILTIGSSRMPKPTNKRPKLLPSNMPSRFKRRLNSSTTSSEILTGDCA
jgi:hypothetical protein